jgi:hypothetical protein
MMYIRIMKTAEVIIEDADQPTDERTDHPDTEPTCADPYDVEPPY